MHEHPQGVLNYEITKCYNKHVMLFCYNLCVWTKLIDTCSHIECFFLFPSSDIYSMYEKINWLSVKGVKGVLHLLTQN